MPLSYHPAVRCFVALDMPRPVCNYLAGLAQQFGNKGNVKWVPAEQLHLTLVFAGDLPEASATGLRAALAAVDIPPLSLQLTGLGHFPPRGDPRVVWAAIGGDVEALGGLYERVAAAAEQHGVAREERGFVPHVTLGRLRSQFGALALVDQLQTVGATLRDKPFQPTGLVFYRSELRPRGPIHTALLRRPVPAP